jgi:hypothetical protein
VRRPIENANGSIDLKAEEIDLLLWPQAKLERFLSASTPVRITGTFDDMRVGVEPPGFLGTLIKWYTNLIYVPFKWLTGERFPADGASTCFDATDRELTPRNARLSHRACFSRPPPPD